MDSTFQNIHGAIAGTSSSTNAVYLLSSSQTVYKQMRVSKVKMDFPSTRRMASQAAWEDNSDYNMKVFGRLGVITSGSTDTVFAAASQSYGSKLGVTTPGSNAIDFVKLTFANDALDCSNSGCLRY